jgi:hypothetical protein
MYPNIMFQRNEYHRCHGLLDILCDGMSLSPWRGINIFPRSFLSEFSLLNKTLATSVRYEFLTVFTLNLSMWEAYLSVNSHVNYLRHAWVAPENKFFWTSKKESYLKTYYVCHNELRFLNDKLIDYWQTKEWTNPAILGLLHETTHCKTFNGSLNHVLF